MASRKAREAREALKALERAGSEQVRDGYTRYGIVAPKAFGVPMGKIQALGKTLGKDHTLALALWKSGWYEARLLACYVEEPERVTVAQMDRWVQALDNWAICDTICFACWDRARYAWGRIRAWSTRKEEFVKRAAFALLASVAVHRKEWPEEKFLTALRLIERGARDERNFVKKGVSWALRTVGRRGPTVHAAAVALARTLIASDHRGAQWVGRDALKDLTRPRVRAAVRRATSPART